MKLRFSRKKGAILLQTLIMSVILSMIAVMLIKWVLARLIIANRMQNSANNTGMAQGYTMQNTQTWNTAPPSASALMPQERNGVTTQKNVSFTSAGGGKFVTTVDDNY